LKWTDGLPEKSGICRLFFRILKDQEWFLAKGANEIHEPWFNRRKGVSHLPGLHDLRHKKVAAMGAG
jgi:hypothetical protein